MLSFPMSATNGLLTQARQSRAITFYAGPVEDWDSQISYYFNTDYAIFILGLSGW